mmetsp:Transcript_5963/g.5125  ORF Transcript_5963/g.5125 Transcript_5963/m.5125 type:complete len:164 (+) Transcript_5963:246-737(+)
MLDREHILYLKTFTAPVNNKEIKRTNAFRSTFEWKTLKLRGAAKLKLFDFGTSMCISYNGKELWLSSGFPISKTSIKKESENYKIYGKLHKINISNFPFVAEEKESMGVERYGHTLIYCKNMIFAIGGSDNISDLNVVEVYFPSKNYWEEIEPLNKPREMTAG